jgi:rfaE bifunctional protein kinase chain/domain
MTNIPSFIQNCKDKHIVVLGDSMIDAYQWGKIERMSPEAPIPVVDVVKREERLGGAANVALNLRNMNAQVTLISLIGQDTHGSQFYNLLNKREITKLGIIEDSERKTTVKTRVIVDDKHVLRVDEEDKHPYLDSIKVLNKLQEIHDDKAIDVLILQDYNKGLLTAEIIQQSINFCTNNNIQTIVDPKKDNFFEYKDVDVFKPNLKEIQEALDMTCQPENPDSVTEICQALQNRIQAKAIFLTLSEYGVAVFTEGKLIQHPAHPRNITDVSGAGDTVVSVASLALAQNIPLSEMAYISNLAGGLVCEHVGVVSITPKMLLNE